MEDKYKAKPPEAVALAKAIEDFNENMRKFNDKVRQVIEEINASQVKAKRSALLNRQSFRAAQRKGHRKGRKRRRK